MNGLTTPLSQPRCSSTPATCSHMTVPFQAPSRYLFNQCAPHQKLHSRARQRKRLCLTTAAAIENLTDLAGARATEEVCFEHDLPQGRLVITPIQEADVGAASVLLTRAFAASAQGIHITDGKKYCRDSLQQPPDGMLLVARLFPLDSSLLPPGQTSRVVATTGLSFTRATRETFPSLQPPDQAAYLSNMAVEGLLRRKGYARRMLAAAQRLAAARGFPALYLHVRLNDQPARQLYETGGFVEVDKDNVVLAKMRGITPRALLCKDLL